MYMHTSYDGFSCKVWTLLCFKHFRNLVKMIPTLAVYSGTLVIRKIVEIVGITVKVLA